MQEATEVTLNTEVEAGASGYTVTGGGDQGIFVKQVLKDSSAAKLFSLREGTTAGPSWGLHHQTPLWGVDGETWKGWASPKALDGPMGFAQPA